MIRNVKVPIKEFCLQSLLEIQNKPCDKRNLNACRAYAVYNNFEKNLTGWNCQLTNYEHIKAA